VSEHQGSFRAASSDRTSRGCDRDALVVRFGNPEARPVVGVRSVLLVTLAKEPTMHLGHLAAAVEISDEYLLHRGLETARARGAAAWRARVEDNGAASRVGG
jgi:hypothetical protein